VQFTVDRKKSGVHIKEFKEVAAFQIILGLKLPEGIYQWLGPRVESTTGASTQPGQVDLTLSSRVAHKINLTQRSQVDIRGSKQPHWVDFNKKCVCCMCLCVYMCVCVWVRVSVLEEVGVYCC